ncbi:MAG: PEP-utilizing enzyme [Candidatus Magasanikbacteria bacterium]
MGHQYQWEKIFIRKNCDVSTFCGVLSTAYKEIWGMTRKKDEYLFGYFKDKHFTYYRRGVVDPRKVGRMLYQKYFNTPKKIISSYHKGLKFLVHTHETTKKWRKVLQHNISSLGLLKVFKQFRKDFDFVNFNYSIMPWWALEAWQHDFEDELERLIDKNNLRDKYEIIINTCLKPWKETAIGKLGRELTRGISIEKLIKKYQFLRAWTVVWYQPITEEWIMSTAQPPVPIEMVSRNKLIKLLSPSVVQKKFIDLAPYIIFFKDWRDDLRREQAYAWNFLFILIAGHFQIEYNDLAYLTLDEIGESLRNNEWPSHLTEQRKDKDFIFTMNVAKQKLQIFPGLPSKYEKAILSAENIGSKREVKGIVAQLGIVSGMVRIIRNHHDIKRIEAGDVLIANTTHPNYLQGMRKAVAFVTDEGGIASHAAIVAREFKKPCIVGTKIATQVFRDGDVVEVDAEKGVIRKL